MKSVVQSRVWTTSKGMGSRENDPAATDLLFHSSFTLVFVILAFIVSATKGYNKQGSLGHYRTTGCLVALPTLEDSSDPTVDDTHAA